MENNKGVLQLADNIIISGKDENGEYIVTKEAWTPENISKLLDEYYPFRVTDREKARTEELDG
ncbi:MAG: hypothetical protein LBD38_02245 [Streptococcaceae bacterium]|jgi:hypothetical protein|nr:hypothetical protein [Streptococcaceae bacterium]